MVGGRGISDREVTIEAYDPIECLHGSFDPGDNDEKTCAPNLGGQAVQQRLFHLPMKGESCFGEPCEMIKESGIFLAPRMIQSRVSLKHAVHGPMPDFLHRPAVWEFVHTGTGLHQPVRVRV